MSVLNDPCLWLNRNWQVIGFMPVRVSIENVCRDMASIMDPETFELMSFDEWAGRRPNTDRWIRSPSCSIAVPEVIVLKEYGERPPRKISFGRANLAKRDAFTCQYCGEQLNLGRGEKKVTIDHVLPRSRGGPNTWENTVASCEDCNTRKADKTPDEAGMRLRKKPHRPRWKPGLSKPVKVKESWKPFLAREGVAV